VDIFKLNNKGFTLIEIAITIAVVGIIGVAFSGFFINSARIIDAVDEREKAVMIAQQDLYFHHHYYFYMLNKRKHY